MSSGAVVVTGGSRGIGARIALRAAQAGHAVAIIYRSNAEAATSVCADVERAGARGVAVQADIAHEGEVERAFKTIDRTVGPVRALVNNAVMAGPARRFVELTAEDLDAVIRTNVYGAFWCSREAVARMSSARGGEGGAIVSLSSAVAMRTGAPGAWVHFAASKSAVETMSAGLAREVAAEAIRVNVVRCGVIDTETRMTQSEDYRARLLAQVPMQRMGARDEVAATVMWLLSAQASYVTGAVLDVTGGY